MGHKAQKDGYSCGFYVMVAPMELGTQHTEHRAETSSLHKNYDYTTMESMWNMYTDLYLSDGVELHPGVQIEDERRR